jgi:hypothetical protein
MPNSISSQWCGSALIIKTLQKFFFVVRNFLCTLDCRNSHYVCPHSRTICHPCLNSSASTLGISGCVASCISNDTCIEHKRVTVEFCSAVFMIGDKMLLKAKQTRSSLNVHIVLCCKRQFHKQASFCVCMSRSLLSCAKDVAVHSAFPRWQHECIAS